MTGKSHPPLDDSDDHGLADDLTRPSEQTVKRKRNASLYKGSRRAVMEQLRHNDGELDRVVPQLARQRQQGRAAIYLRVSTEEQARVGGGMEGYSIPYQREACQRKAEEMGLAVTGEYTDPGYSGRTTKRPKLQELLVDLESGRITHVIVHKLDRLSRSKNADYVIDTAMEAVGAHIVSVMEHVDDTPAGKLNLQLYRGMAHYYSDNLAYEVVKGLTTKHKSGGTPGRAPLGYLNKRRIEGVADIRWVEPDPERAHHIRWAFEQYATGDWSLAALVAELEARGLRTRASEKIPSRPITVGALHRLLINPYFIGIVSYKGVYQEGSHEPLVSVETWLRVQDVMKAHNYAGEKDRQHAQYLKGSIWCGECGQRMIFSRNKGRGGTYDYFFCMGRRSKTQRCSRPYVAVEAIEDGVAAFYRSLQLSLSPLRAAAIRDAATRELASQTEQAERDVAEAARQHARLDNERRKLLEAHYAGAIPLDMLKREMDRLTRELAETEMRARAVTQTQEQLTRQLDTALDIATHCYALYENATKRERRMFNQGFFTRLYVGADGSIDRAELQEPFVQLMARDADTIVRRADHPVHAPENAFLGDLAATGTDGDTTIPVLFSRGQKAIHAAVRRARDAVLVSFDEHKRTQLTLGSNNELLAVAEGFEPSVGGYPTHA
uniref:recombinase family protein n=1 Tax=Mycolicibacterium sp. TaxID=2320850 RepID=UPI0037C87DAC